MSAPLLSEGSATARKNRRQKMPIRPMSVPLGQDLFALWLLTLASLLLLAVLSYNAADVSWNSAGSSQVRNWIGPLGAYSSDALLQLWGYGIYPWLGALIGVGVWMLWPSAPNPSRRQLFGLTALMLAWTVAAHLLAYDPLAPFGAGGVVGIWLGQALAHHLGGLGAWLVLLTWTLAAVLLIRNCRLRHIWRIELPSPPIEGQQAFDQDADREQKVEPTPPASPAAFPSPWWRKFWPGQEISGDAPLSGGTTAHNPALVPLGAYPHHDAPISKSLSTGPIEGQESWPESVEQAIEQWTANGEPIEAELLSDEDEQQLPEHAPLPTSLTVAAAFTLDETGDLREEPLPIDAQDGIDGEDLLGEGVEIKERLPSVIDQSQAGFQGKTFADMALPSYQLLNEPVPVACATEDSWLRSNAERLTNVLRSYGIDGKVREIRPGPVVTLYEYVPGPGTKVSRIASLADDIAMSMAALRVRIVAPIPGKGAVGIEIPNAEREPVALRDIVSSEIFLQAKSPLTMALGKDIEGAPFVVDMTAMPHLLVAGATGAGKSVSLNAMITSILLRASPQDVRMLMVDPKMLEFSVYEGIPHLLLPVVTDPKQAASALRWAVGEMERRYTLLSSAGVRNIRSYNQKLADRSSQGGWRPHGSKIPERLPYLLVIVDELADLMMVASRDVEVSIMRLAQMARAAGIHLMLATQRPSVDVLTGVIKANFPTRIAFQVASRHDSRTILDSCGAENLLGMGDMLYLAPGAGGISRVHGAYVSDEEIERITDHWRLQGAPEYDETVLAQISQHEPEGEQEEQDSLYEEALAIAQESSQISVSMVQRRLRIGYNRASRLVEALERAGVVGPSDGAKGRAVLMS